MRHIFTLLLTRRFGDCVVAHQPNVQIFLRLERVLFCADVSVPLYIFSRSILDIRVYTFLPSWRLQLSNIAGIDSRFAKVKYHPQ